MERQQERRFDTTFRQLAQNVVCLPCCYTHLCNLSPNWQRCIHVASTLCQRVHVDTTFRQRVHSAACWLCWYPPLQTDTVVYKWPQRCVNVFTLIKRWGNVYTTLNVFWVGRTLGWFENTTYFLTHNMVTTLTQRWVNVFTLIQRQVNVYILFACDCVCGDNQTKFQQLYCRLWSSGVVG